MQANSNEEITQVTGDGTSPDAQWLIPSGSRPGKVHLVTVTGTDEGQELWTCTCTAGLHGKRCYHRTRAQVDYYTSRLAHRAEVRTRSTQRPADAHAALMECFG